MTKRQQQVYNLLLFGVRKHPSFGDMKKVLKVTSNETITGHLKSLMKKGLVRREKGKYFAIPIKTFRYVYDPISKTINPY